MVVQFRAVRPKRLDTRPLVRDFEQLANQVVDGIESDYKAGVRDWQTQVRFEKRRPTNQAGRIRGRVSTTNRIYLVVHNGRPAVTIRPRRPGGTLRFQANYRRKSVPGQIPSRAGGASGPVVYTKRPIRQRAREGVNQTKPIQQKWQKFTIQRARSLIRRSRRL